MKDLHPRMQAFFSCRIDTVTGMWYDFLRNKRDKGSGGMKVLWGTNLNPIKDGDRFDGEAFATAETDDALLEALDDAEEQEEKIIDSAELPLALTIIKWIGYIPLLIFLPDFLFLLSDGYEPFVKAYNNEPVFYQICGVLAVVSLVLTLIEKYRQHRMNNSEKRADIRKRIRSARRACYAALDIPKNTTEVDIFSMCYRLQGGEVEPVNYGLGDFLNTPVRMWRRDDTLCMADVGVRLEVPLACVTALTYRQSTVHLNEWNKRRSWRQYAADGVYAARKGLYVKGYCILSMQYRNETYQLWLPGHEKTAIEKLTGCQAVEVQVSRADEKRNRQIARSEERNDRRQLRMEEEKKKRRADKTPLKPVFYMHMPKVPEEVTFIVLPSVSEKAPGEEDSAQESLVFILQMVAYFVPMVLACILWPEKSFSKMWSSLFALIGSIIMGVGLRSIIAAWVKQYPGHIYTAACFLVGAAMMAVSMLA